MSEAFLVGGVRTPNGSYGGSLRELPAVELAAIAGREALRRAGVSGDDVSETILSHCRQAGNGPNTGRQVALKSGVRLEAPAQTINMACASGLKAVQLADEAVRAGRADVVLVVAVESMSTMPYLASSSLRWAGQRRGNIEVIDGWQDGGTDPICGLNMGETAENIAQRWSIDREAQDEWSLRSHQRLAAAWAEGRFGDEVIAVETEEASLAQDETYRPDANLEKMARLRPAFVKDGTVTAANSSQMADGAAAIVVASAEAVERLGMSPVGRLVGCAAVGVDPTVMGIGPTAAIPAVLEETNLTVEDIDLFEINEAFASQIVQNVRELSLDPERVNVNGGGIALGHPTGQSGCRLVVATLYELGRRGEQRGIASLCAGGGQGIAGVIERIDA